MTEAILSLPYGDGALSAALPAANLVGVLLPEQAHENRGDEAEILRAALDAPIGTAPLRSLVNPGQKVCIVTSDLTRPCPSARMLPFVMDELAAAGVPDENVLIVIALGLHRPMSADELRAIVGEATLRRVRVVNHDLENTVPLGVTAAGTPVEIFRPVVEADFRICLGNLEFHWFAGYSGGAKAILPGVASRTAIYANHGLMVRPGVGTARLDDNPLRRDLEEGCAMLGVDFLLNVVVDGEHRILDAVAGDVTLAHRRGCELIARRGMAAVAQQADIVVAGAGGFPKDINMLQAHKGLENASYFVRDGGVLILVAECREGWGNASFESWMKAAASPQELTERIQREFVLGGHKAAGIARIEQRAEVFLVSAMPDEEAERMFMTPFHDLQTALQAAFERIGPSGRVLALPFAGSIIPRFDG